METMSWEKGYSARDQRKRPERGNEREVQCVEEWKEENASNWQKEILFKWREEQNSK